MNKFVGLVIITPFADGTIKVLIQKRRIEDDFPGAYHIAIRAMVAEGEDFYKALIRVSNKEYGSKFTQQCQANVELIQLMNEKTDDGEILVYGAIVPEKHLDLIRLERTLGGIDYVTSDLFFNGEIIEITEDKKISGYPRNVIAMPADEIQTIKKGVEIFQRRRDLGIEKYF